MAHKILTTHVGSLPRSKQVTDLVFAREAGVPIDSAGFSTIIAAAVDDIVARQKAAGIDLPSDGEMSKISYATYIKDRLTGFDGDSARRPPVSACCPSRAPPSPTARPGRTWRTWACRWKRTSTSPACSAARP